MGRLSYLHYNVLKSLIPYLINKIPILQYYDVYHKIHSIYTLCQEKTNQRGRTRQINNKKGKY